MIHSLSFSQSIGLALSSLFVYFICLAIYRLYFSRVCHIPGPRLAALTYFYQFYYDTFPHSGQFLFKCGRLHEKYGPVIRIGPDEVQVNDIAFYNEIYPQGNRRRDKSRLWFYHEPTDQIAGKSVWTAIDHDVHRMRRAAFSQYFSKSKVSELQARISKKVELLKERMLSWEDSGELLDLYDAFSALTLEVISEYVFGRSISVLPKPDLGHEYAQLGREVNKIHAVARAFPGPMRLFFQLPEWMMSGSKMFQIVKRMNNEVDRCTEEAFEEAVTKPDKQSINVMREIVDNSSLPSHEKELSRLKQEGIIFVTAGMETTARTITVTFYHVLNNPDVLKRLQKELGTVIPSSSASIPPLSALEKLPYLTAVINEGHRLAHAVTGRLARVAPDEDLVVHGYKIPSGVTMSQSHYFLHRNEEIFPEPLKFRPERFLKEGVNGIRATEALRNLVPFSRGARMCVGLNLAWAELYLSIAVILTSVKMELVDTTDYDVTVVQDHFIGVFPDESKGVRVKVLGKA